MWWFSRCVFLQVLSSCSSFSHSTSRCSPPCFSPVLQFSPSSCLLLGGTLELMHSPPRAHRYLYRTSGSLSLCSLLLLSCCHMFASAPLKNTHSHNLFISMKYLHSHIQYANTHPHIHIYKHCYLSHLPHFTAF